MHGHQVVLGLSCCCLSSADKTASSEAINTVYTHSFHDESNSVMPTEDSLYDEAQKIANELSLMWLTVKKSSVSVAIKEQYEKRVVQLCRVNQGFSQHFRTSLLSKNAQTADEIKKEVWKEYVDKMRQLTKEMQLLLP